MASRADYLSKYLSKDDSKKAKKKSKKAGGAIAEANSVKKETTLIKDTIPEPESEFEPTSVDLGSSLAVKGGFKRIDNGQIVKNETPSSEMPKEENLPATVYRDLSGRIIDLKEKRAEIKARKEEEAKREEIEKEQINTGELDRIRQDEEAKKLAKSTRFDYSKTSKEYTDYMGQKDRFEDPLAGRLATSALNPEVSVSATNRPVYRGGQHPVNRFKIQAGHFWDGIDRGNGFEERLVKARDLIYVQRVTDQAAKETYTEYDFE
ncbi:hypothetical protein METBIDRAFT_36937 [Metschnikowia bicuspidata var. bicuspidata NRRL YB-4993]|uniref:Pre-mRNA-splicing factor CWC26 n=1 Tax=Metschnikowia bicuspidata var. bicuspidata NRRL YB-4993 TaxID=869754 RepID=A0A1A0HG30_9ASCO|nr:hypothetical protein METBIDRAFT_36937 [Metschnikowia bicuspidata var. bicuspidata NRRL YB-4993]OBA22852.1 hypothetical protein METBIDRAFT_36937 [Metschnikowia bicuspidata var. bicuspidata NRRL YB-4993]